MRATCPISSSFICPPPQIINILCRSIIQLFICSEWKTKECRLSCVLYIRPVVLCFLGYKYWIQVEWHRRRTYIEGPHLWHEPRTARCGNRRDLLAVRGALFWYESYKYWPLVCTQWIYGNYCITVRPTSFTLHCTEEWVCAIILKWCQWEWVYTWAHTQQQVYSRHISECTDDTCSSWPHSRMSLYTDYNSSYIGDSRFGSQRPAIRTGLSNFYSVPPGQNLKNMSRPRIPCLFQVIIHNHRITRCYMIYVVERASLNNKRLKKSIQ